MSIEKPDASDIRNHIAALKSSSWLGESRKWWVDFLFHFTDIQNTVNILEQGKLLCRQTLEDTGLMVNDNASPNVIIQTEPKWKEYVRLYFRPRTPTQYNNEGFRPITQRELGGAHCPVPIYFLFDSQSVLCKQDSLFSEGSLATDTLPFKDASQFCELPFHYVYHDSWFNPLERATIVFHRHAEVIVPTYLELKYLRYIWCRSQAEYQTLMHLLSPDTWLKWEKKIGVGAKPNLFFRKWTFVENVDLSNKTIEVQFNRNTAAPGPFLVEVEITEKETATVYRWKDEHYKADGTLTLSLENLKHPENYTVKLLLEGQLAFSAKHIDDTVPF